MAKKENNELEKRNQAFLIYKVKEIFPESKLAPSYKYRTNWITFYK